MMIAALFALLLQAGLPACEWCGVAEAPRNLTSTMRIAGPSERGDRLVLSGRVLRAGKPVPNVVLYAYHTNAGGIYPKRGDETGNARRHGYLRGWLKTDARGSYRIETIRPGSYPSRSDPAHVHVIVGERGRDEAYIDDFVFAGDPLVTPAYRRRVRDNGGSGIVTLRKQNGTWTGTRDIILP